MLCQFKDEEGRIDSIMCGISVNYCSSDQWCTDPSNVKLSYWTSKTYPKNSSCDSGSKLIFYKQMLCFISMKIRAREGQINYLTTHFYIL